MGHFPSPNVKSKKFYNLSPTWCISKSRQIIKTLHPKIHGGLLGRRGCDDDIMQHHDIPNIDLLIVNLYPFQATIANDNCTLQQAIEQIDIGGPAMLRAAAKNHQDVTVIIDVPAVIQGPRI